MFCSLERTKHNEPNVPENNKKKGIEMCGQWSLIIMN